MSTCPLCKLPPWSPNAVSSGSCDCSYEELEAALRASTVYAELSAALLREWLATEIDPEDDEYEPWMLSFTNRVIAALAKNPNPAPDELCNGDSAKGHGAEPPEAGAGAGYGHETGKKPMQEAQERIQRDMATKGTARAQDVFTILGDPSKGVTVHNPEWPCRILGPEEDELRHQSCTHSETPRTDAILEIASIEDRYLPLLDLARELEARTEFQVGGDAVGELVEALRGAVTWLEGWAEVGSAREPYERAKAVLARYEFVACTQPPERPKCKHPANDVCLNCDTGYAAANRGAK